MSAAEMFWAAPPVSRTITAAAVVLSVPVWMGLIDPYHVVFITRNVWKVFPPQIWRVITTFILTGPKLGLLMDPYFLYSYGSQLETGASRFARPGDFFIYLVFVAFVILLTGGIYLNGTMLLSPLTLALAYTFAQENPNSQVNYFIVTFSAKYLPYTMLAMTFVMSSPGAALLQVTGLIAAHAYDFLTRIWPEYGGGRRLLETPLFVQQWFAPPGGTATARSYGTAFSGRPAGSAQPQANSSDGGGWASGFSGGNTWASRGQGRRLGGE